MRKWAYLLKKENKMKKETKMKPNNEWKDELVSLLIGMRLSKKNKLEIDRLISKTLQQQREEATKIEFNRMREYLDKVIDDNNKLLISFYKSGDIKQLKSYVEDNLLINNG